MACIRRPGAFINDTVVVAIPIPVVAASRYRFRSATCASGEALRRAHIFRMLRSP